MFTLTFLTVDPGVRSVRQKLSHKKVWRLLETALARYMLIFLVMDGFQVNCRARERMRENNTRLPA